MKFPSFRKKSVFELSDLDGVIETFDELVEKSTIIAMIESGELSETSYTMREVTSKGKPRVVWSIRRKKRKESTEKVDEVRNLPKDKAMKVLKEEAQRLKKDADDFKKLQEAVVGEFGSTDKETDIDNPMEGFKKGMGTALYRGLTSDPNQVTSKVFETMDSISMLAKGAGLLMAKKAGVSLNPNIDNLKRKEKKSEDGRKKQITLEGLGDEDEVKEEEVKDQEND